MVDKNTFQLGESIAIYILYINVTHLAKRGRKPSLSKHSAVASSGAESDQRWAFQKVLSNTSYRSSPSPLASDLYPHSLNPTALWSDSYFSLFYRHTSTRKKDRSQYPAIRLFCTIYAENTIWETQKHYFRDAYLSCRWNYETGFVWEFLLLLLIN